MIILSAVETFQWTELRHNPLRKHFCFVELYDMFVVLYFETCAISLFSPADFAIAAAGPHVP